MKKQIFVHLHKSFFKTREVAETEHMCYTKHRIPLMFNSKFAAIHYRIRVTDLSTQKLSKDTNWKLTINNLLF